MWIQKEKNSSSQFCLVCYAWIVGFLLRKHLKGSEMLQNMYSICATFLHPDSTASPHHTGGTQRWQGPRGDGKDHSNSPGRPSPPTKCCSGHLGLATPPRRTGTCCIPCCLTSSMGITWAYPPPAAPPAQESIWSRQTGTGLEKKQPPLNTQSETYSVDDTFLRILISMRGSMVHPNKQDFHKPCWLFQQAVKREFLTWNASLHMIAGPDIGYIRATLCSCPDLGHSHAHAAVGWKDIAVTSKHCFWTKPSHPCLSAPFPLPLRVQAKEFAVAYPQVEWRD